MKTIALPDKTRKQAFMLILPLMMVLFQSTASAQLSGTYTIGTGQDYATFSAASNALETLGVSGPVVFNVSPGTYIEQVTLSYIPTASETNTITFQSSTGDSTDVILQYDAEDNNDNFVLKIRQSNYLTIKNLTIRGLDPNYYNAVVLEDYAFFFTLEGCHLSGFYNTNAQVQRALLYSSGAALKDITIKGNKFSYGSFGIHFNANVQYNHRTFISRNDFDSLGYVAIDLIKHEYTKISNNTISYGTYGMRLSTSSSSVVVQNNQLDDIANYGMFINNMKSAAGFESYIMNNSVSLKGNANTGVDIRYCSFLNFYNNSVLLNSELANAKVLNLAGSVNQTINVMNNNLVAYSKGYTIYSHPAEQVKNCNYNNYYTPAAWFAYWGENCEDFSTLKMISGKDEHSMFAYPNFLSETELIPNSAWLDGAGSPLSSVPEDIAGNMRDAVNPDIGAWEFTAEAYTKPAMSGQFTIGTGGDYASLGAAVSEIRIRGLSDTLWLNFLPGFYEEQYLITPITGANSNKPLIIGSSTKNSNDVHLWYNADGADDNYVLHLKGASFIHLTNLSLHAMDSRYARVLELTGMVDSLHIRNCSFISTEQNDGNPNAIIFNTNNINFHYQLFENDSLLNGSTAIMMNLSNYPSDPGEVHVRNSYFQNGYANIFTRKVNSLYIINNEMLSNTQGIYINDVQNNMVVERNYLYAKYGGNLDINSVGFENFIRGKIVNNMMMSDFHQPNKNCLRIYNSDHLDIFYNSFSLMSDNNSRVPCNIQNSEHIRLMNNIFSSKGLAYSFYTNNTVYESADYNCYYSQGTNLAFWNGACSNLEAIRTASGRNQNSIHANPSFVSDTDLHTSSEFLDGKANPLPSVDRDIDGQFRDSEEPDIGADEFTIIPNNPPVISQSIPDVLLDEDPGQTEVINLNSVFSDPDSGDDLVFTAESSNDSIMVEIAENILFINSTQNYYGEGMIIVTARDKLLETVKDTFMVTIQSINDLPTGVDDKYAASGTIEMCVLENDYDVESGDLVLSEIFQPNHGNAEIIGETQCISYTPTDFQSPKDSVYYVVEDINGGKDTAMAEISLFLIQDGFTGAAFMDEGLSHGSASWGDYDHDGDLDLLINGWTGTLDNYRTEIYKNNGEGFDLTDISLYDISPGTSHAASWIDYDNDNDLDLIIMGRMSNSMDIRTFFYENNQNIYSLSSDVTPMHLNAGSVDWADYDNDGKYDLLISGTAGPTYHTEIYRNLGATPYGSWTMDNANIALPGIWSGESNWVDFDSDGDMDIFICGFGADPSALFRNDGNEFTRITTAIPYAGNAASSWSDYDQDGDPDLVLCGKADNNYLSKIFRNDGPGAGNNQWVFTDIDAGLTGMSSGDAEWGDADNDGDPDLFITGNTGLLTSASILYINNDGQFNQSEQEFTDMGRSCAAWADYDNDGDLDLLISGYSPSLMAQVTLFYHNERKTENDPPSTPSNLNHELHGDSVILRWDPATDDHSESLYYNVRIGTEPGMADILNPMSSAEGLRMVVGRGNAGSNRMLIIDGLQESETYYWTVQALDHSYLGSAFAVEQSFMIGTSVKELKHHAMKLYPNPATELLYLELSPGLQDHADIAFFDITGTRISVDIFNGSGSDKLCFNIRNLPAGVYFVVLKSKEGIFKEKFVKY